MANKYQRKNKFIIPKFDLGPQTKKDILAVLFFSLALISVLSFLNLAGGLGVKIFEVARFLFGWGFVLLPFALIILGIKLTKQEDGTANSKGKLVFAAEQASAFFGLTLFTLALLGALHIFYPSGRMMEMAKIEKGGGFLGMLLAWPLQRLLGVWGGLIVLAALIVISILIVSSVSLRELADKIRKFLKILKIKGDAVALPLKENIKGGLEEEPKINYNESEEESGGENKYSEEKISDSKLSSLFKKIVNPPVFTVKKVEKEEIRNEKLETEEKEIRKEEKEIEKLENEEIDEESSSPPEETETLSEIPWRLPTLNLLDGSSGEPTSGDIKANSNIIRRTLQNFGIEVKMGEVNVGPTVTQYTIKPAVGIKLSRITALQNDLALALAARSLRIEAPIPGRSWAGIEIPNRAAAMVRLKNILASSAFRERKSNLSIILGRDVAGNPAFDDLAKMPHLLIAGSTGSGKTVCVNALITSLLYQNSPADLKFIMVDPKRVELMPYNKIPHLLTPVITDPDKAINSLKWSISEMENRYDLLSQLGFRNIESYNKSVEAKYQNRGKLFYIIIIIDELADLMATHGREMEAAVVRLAQMARAVGIHLVLSTQRPSVEVITGLIKANITTRIAFQVASQIDSRTIINVAGAEKLLGNGDMLYLSGNSNKPIRVQGAFVSESEVRKITSFVKNQKVEESESSQIISEDKNKAEEIESFSAKEENMVDDDLYEEAVETVKKAGKASASLLQRRLRIGYARAARMLDIMEERGVIGPADGAKPRDILI